MKSYVLDSHRPLHHNNLNSNPAIVVVYDPEQDLEEDMPSLAEIEFFNANRMEINLEELEDDLSDGVEDEDEEDENDEEEDGGEEESKKDARSDCEGEEVLGGDDPLEEDESHLIGVKRLPKKREN